VRLQAQEEEMVVQTVDVAVIGAGPAGLAAPIKAKEAGAEE
jgi:flavin-dependent dehydrogenase